MKVLLVTVAGMSSRFSTSIGTECLKCIYYEHDAREALLYRLLHQWDGFNFYIIVGGYKMTELRGFLNKNCPDLGARIALVENAKYKEYGSGYSLLLGLEEAKKMPFDELVFAEGDLCIDRESFQKVCMAPNNVVTCNREAILADKAVAFYYDMKYRIHYIYDIGHAALEIKEPFKGIFNSGQVWKFIEAKRLFRAVSQIKEEEWCGTNLCLMQEYFGGLDSTGYELVEFGQWVNCNTVEDFEKTKGVR